MNALEKLQIKPKRFLIGKQLPEQERVPLDIWTLGLDEIYLAKEISEAKDEEVRGKAIIKIISKALRIPEEEAKKLHFDFIEEILEAIAEQMNVDDEKKEKIKKLLEERKAT